jgi:uncharacterized protein YbbK (DUF523 family)
VRVASEVTPAHLPTPNDIGRWPTFTAEEPLKVLVSSCITGVSCGADGTSYEAPYLHTARLLALPNVMAVPFCPEDFALGTPRDVPDIDDGNGFDVIDGKARVVTSAGRDCTQEIVAAANAMLALAEREDVKLALLMDISAACGSQVIYLGDRRDGVYQRGQGVCAALLARHGVPVVSQRDFKTLGAIVHKLDPDVTPPPGARDHHESDWYRSYFGAP